jgi:hypothetical protein
MSSTSPPSAASASSSSSATSSLRKRTGNYRSRETEETDEDVRKLSSPHSASTPSSSSSSSKVTSSIPSHEGGHNNGGEVGSEVGYDKTILKWLQTPREVTTTTTFGTSRSVNEFEKLSQIGEGTYGIVYKARDRINNQIVALKKIRMERETDGIPITALRGLSPSPLTSASLFSSLLFLFSSSKASLLLFLFFSSLLSSLLTTQRFPF